MRLKSTLPSRTHPPSPVNHNENDRRRCLHSQSQSRVEWMEWDERERNACGWRDADDEVLPATRQHRYKGCDNSGKHHGILPPLNHLSRFSHCSCHTDSEREERRGGESKNEKKRIQKQSKQRLSPPPTQPPLLQLMNKRRAKGKKKELRGNNSNDRCLPLSTPSLA